MADGTADGHGSQASGGTRDLNGRQVTAGRLARLRAKLTRDTAREAPLSISDDDAVLVVGSADHAAASSVVLDASPWSPDAEVILCHVLVLPPAQVDAAVAVAALDGYEQVEAHRWPGITDAVEPEGDAQQQLGVAPSHQVLVLARVQLLDAIHLSQERSRMASLGSRYGGTVVCWQILQRRRRTALRSP